MATTKTSKPSPIPRNLRRLRIQAGLTQAELAEISGTTDATISRIERGRFLPSHPLLVRLAEGVGATEADLLQRKVKITKPSLRPCEAKLLALVRRMEDAQVDDLIRGVKLLLEVGRASS